MSTYLLLVHYMPEGFNEPLYCDKIVVCSKSFDVKTFEDAMASFCDTPKFDIMTYPEATDYVLDSMNVAHHPFGAHEIIDYICEIYV